MFYVIGCLMSDNPFVSRESTLAANTTPLLLSPVPSLVPTAGWEAQLPIEPRGGAAGEPEVWVQQCQLQDAEPASWNRVIEGTGNLCMHLIQEQRYWFSPIHVFLLRRYEL